MNIKSILKKSHHKYGSGPIIIWLWHILKGHRLQVAVNVFIGIISTVLSLIRIWIIKHAIDVASGAVPGNIYWAVSMIGLFILAGFITTIISIWNKNILGVKAQNKMQQNMLEKLLKSQWYGKEKRHSGDILNRLELDVTSVVTFLTETLPSTISVLIMFIGAFFILYSMDHTLPLIITATFPIFLLISRFYIDRMRILNRNIKDNDSKIQSILQETIQNRMLIKTLESDDFMMRKLKDSHADLRDNIIRKSKFTILSRVTVNTGFSIGYLTAFLWAALRMSSGTLTFGGMAAFLQLVNKIQGPAKDLTSLIPAFVTIFTTAERLMELEEEPLEDKSQNVYMQSSCGIKLQKVTYQYEENKRKIIDNLTFDFKPGTITAIIGETGAGKTTLARLLLALIKPQKGEIRIYNQNQNLLITPGMRCNFVFVPQGNTLLSGTIRENLKLGNKDATNQEMEDALRTACADFVFKLPEGLDTTCSEGGGGLSEGQAQRICIARALLKPSNIMILDEATGALDAETEIKLLDNLLTENQKTIIFITHRMAVINYCHQTLTIKSTKHL